MFNVLQSFFIMFFSSYFLEKCFLRSSNEDGSIEIEFKYQGEYKIICWIF